MEYRDTGANPDTTQAVWDEFSNKDDIAIVFLYQTEDAEILRAQAAEKQIPLMVASGSIKALYGDVGNEPGWVFSVTPTFADQMGAFCDYISENWDSFGIEGDPVIGHVSFLGAFGQSSETPEALAYCDSLGIGYAGGKYFFPGIPDISTQVQGVIDDGANIIYTTSAANGPAQVANTLTALGLADQVLVAGPNVVLDTSTIILGGENVDGMVGQLPYYWWDEISHPGIAMVTDYWANNRLPRYNNPADGFAIRNIAYLGGWMGVDFFRQVMIETINRVDPDHVDGAAVFETITDGTRREPLQGVISVQYDEFRRSPNLTRIGVIQLVENEAGQTPEIVALTDFVETPDLHPRGEDVIGE